MVLVISQARIIPKILQKYCWRVTAVYKKIIAYIVINAKYNSKTKSKCTLPTGECLQIEILIALHDLTLPMQFMSENVMPL